ncbi:HAMP domain-containing protein [Stenotrophomonas sp. SRS1]|uniref:methyl-accepting chemotaxis protein n=1 Tax=Stenotrophomonas sp. SRS1 TaxID=2870345 RepID=UPI00223789BB|nr:methyl-accepting chemotaxis protein [Stenotrophomonas sp. SRS1]MCW6029857.1 HAMP domain-containing protein [Stenotrophomonas sp. SRS1]
MEYFKHMRVGSKLAVGFGILLILLISSSSLALYQAARIGQQVSEIETNGKKMSLLTTMRGSNYQNERNLRDLILDGEENGPAILERIQQTRAAYAKAREDLDAIPHNAEGMQAKQAIGDAQNAAVAAHNQIIERATANDDVAAIGLLYGEAEPLMAARSAAIQAAVELQERRSAESAAIVNTSIQTSRSLLITFALVALVAGGLLAWLITRSLVGPLRRAMDVSRSIADGRFDTTVGNTSRDETGQLLASMDAMTQRLRAFSEAQQDMAHRHDLGELAYRIDASAFPGDFGRIAAGTNALVGSSIELTQKIIDVVRNYAVGDLAEDLEALPGEKARFTEAMAITKQNLAAINGQIHRLASAAAAGDFSQRGDAGAFDHEFKVMIERLNTMMQISDENLRQLSELLKAIASGDLTVRMEGEFQGVFARMRDDANTTVGQLTGIIGSIQVAAGSINTAAVEIASGNNDLSRRTEQQAANLEETAASMEELTSTVRQNAEHARQANQLAIGAGAVASEGGQVVQDVVVTMRGIEASSKKIADIITVIDGIAFQTNILALNAAVEAARAGEQGRGFAVVASEVRTLAQRSAGAAKEIKELIEDSVDKVAIGAGLVDKAGVTMTEIVTSVQKVTDIMAEISAASQEQSAGIEQVSQTVVQLDETTQQNAALVEEATAAARSMEEQAMALTGAVARFRLATQSGVQTQPMAAPRGAASPLKASMPAAAKPRAGSSTVTPLRQVPAATVDGDWREF